jgi:putative Holliday junction resolvase
MATDTKILLALDVGERRIGVARAVAGVGIASPLATIEQSDAVMDDLRKLLDENHAAVLVIGLPRGLDGQETAQTHTVRQFAARLGAKFDIPIALQDEALTSRKAAAELDARRKPYTKADVDALAATYILEDYMSEHTGEF